ncbi:MAG: F0F1 ATP synthase subunit delta, partial [Eggerthellaceae bacterium]|nr:F0F1 ATP synthase subunit delta [Eggerthellaceae bacterium]
MPTNRLIVKEQISTYTRLLFEAANNDGGPEGVLNVCIQAKEIVQIIRGNSDLESALKDPGYTPEQKAQLARNVFAEADPALANTIAVMAERGEIDYLARVASQLEVRMA